MERRNSDDEHASQQPPRGNPNVFDDEYALDPDEDDFMPGVSDGFRPNALGDEQTHDRTDSPRPPLPAARSADTDLRRLASRNSTMKAAGTCARESMSNDDRSPLAQNPGSSSQATAVPPHRDSVSSTASFATMARSESPFAMGPSHPYGMYTQNTMARSPSVTTSSTQQQQQPQPPVLRQQPTHPYGLYPQNVVEDEPPEPPVPSAIPVGFPGLNTGYHRQIGPDGEEQDIIGPDGHTEQLPPYSRYPEEGPTKAAMAAEEISTTVQPVAAPPTTPADNAAAPAAAAPSSHPSGAEDESQTSSRLPTSAIAATSTPEPARSRVASSPPSVTSTSQSWEHSASEKPDAEGSYAKGWKSKKLWGKLPIGVAAVLVILLVVFAIVLGAAIGTFVAKNKSKGGRGGPRHGEHDPSPQVTGPTNSLFDATPIPTPASLPPLPAGTFALPLGVPQESSPGCLTMANQLSAWSCKMTFAPLVLSINNTSTSPQVSVGGFTKPDGGVQYGVQPPSLPQAMSMQLVMDMDYKAFNAAFHFNTNYDKVVVLNAGEFAAGASLSKRDGDDKPQFRHRYQVMPGDSPWFCFWNQTYIEGYIYAYDNSSAASLTSFPTAWPTNSAGNLPVETATPSGAAGGPPTPTAARRSRRGDGDYPRLPPYPRIVKMEERRLPGAPQPYCQKMQLLDNGSMTKSTDKLGNPIVIFLQENDPSIQEFQQAGAGPPPESPTPTPATNSTDRKRSELEKRRDPAGACHCQWMFQ